MGYIKSRVSGELLELYMYEQRPRNFGRSRVSSSSRSQNRTLSSEISVLSKKQRQRRQDSISRCSRNFKRIVLSNLYRSAYPLFASLTYAENMRDEVQAGSHFNAFTRALRDQFGETIRYIAVKERQERGAIHFHALIWGIPTWVVRGERDSRMVAGIWGRGFADLIQTDGDPRIASYMAKYMSKNFLTVHLEAGTAMLLVEILKGLKW